MLIAALTSTFVLVLPATSWAHGLSKETVTFQAVGQKFIGVGSVPFAEVGLSDPNGDGLLDSAELTSQLATTSGTLLANLQSKVVITCNGEPLAITTAWVNAAMPDSASSDGSAYVPITLITADFVGTAQTFSIKWGFAIPGVAVILQSKDSALMSNLNQFKTATFNISFWSAARSFLTQGILHISGGLDHLLFLMVLALGIFKVSVSRKTLIRATKLVAAFTLGHAVSFSLAYFGLVSLPSGVVEPVISLSIAVTAAVAITKREWEQYWIIAAGIGLIHGLGFASSLAKLGLATSQHATAIISFNLGVDLAQVVVVSCVAVSVASVRKLLPTWSERLRIVVLVATGLLGLIWTVARVASAIGGVWSFWK